MLSVTHIVFEVATIMNFVMVIMYWSMVHHVVIDKFKGLEYFHMYAIHIFPAISVLVNFYLTDIWLVPSALYLEFILLRQRTLISPVNPFPWRNLDYSNS